MSNFTEMDCYLFGQATHYDIYRKMGAHKMTIEGEEGVCFDVWAPHADRVYVIGEFNGWNETSHEMKRVTPETMGVYELFVPGVQIGCMYKFLIIAQDGRKLYKADPYANYAQLRPETASIVTDISNFLWSDTEWMNARKKLSKEEVYEQPMAIYEVHPGSWMRHPEVDVLVDEAWKIPGVIGSRITGGGFGGCTVSIVKDASVDEFKEKLTKAYEEKVGKTPEFYVVSIGDGPSRLI